MNVQTQAVTAQAGAVSSDLQDVTTDLTLNYKIDSGHVIDVYSKLGTGYQSTIIQPAIQEIVKSVTSNYTAEQLIKDRPAVKAKIDEALVHRLATYNILSDQISITNFQFSDQFNQAIEAKVVAEQNVLTAKNVLEQKKVEAQQAVATAEGARDSAIATAEGQSKSLEVVAQGQAKAINDINDAIKNSPEFLKYKYLDKWDGQVSKVVLGSGATAPVVQLPISPNP